MKCLSYLLLLAIAPLWAAMPCHAEGVHVESAFFHSSCFTPTGIAVDGQDRVCVRVQRRLGPGNRPQSGTARLTWSAEGEFLGETSDEPASEASAPQTAAPQTAAPAGPNVRDLQVRLKGFRGEIQSAATDSLGNAYIIEKDGPPGLAFSSYDAEGRFRFARGADFDLLAVSLPSRVLETGEANPLTIRLTTGLGNGWLAPSQMGAAQGRPAPRLAAFMRDIRGGSWHRAALARDAGDRYTLAPSTRLTCGAYTLRITSAAVAEPLDARAMHCDLLIVTPARGKLGSLTLLADRNRSVWQCGEEVPFTIVARSRERRIPVILEVELAGVKPVRKLSASIMPGSNTIAMSVPAEVTARLAPGRYTVVCREPMATRKQDEIFSPSMFTFILVSPLRPTRFTMGHYLETGGGCTREVLESSVSMLARRGFNLDIAPACAVATCNAAPVQGGIHALREPASPELAAELEALARAVAYDPRLPAPDLIYHRDRYETYLETAALHSIDTRLQLTANDTVLRFLPEQWPDEQRQVQVLTQYASRYSSFAGWSFAGRAHLERADDPAGGTEAMAKAREDFTKEFGSPPEQRPDEWFDAYNAFIPRLYRAWHDAALAVNPAISNTSSPGEPMTAAQGKYPPLVYEGFPLVLAHVHGKQWHEQSIYPFQTDLARRPGKPLISLQSGLHADESGQYSGREYMLALTRGLQGVGVSQSGLHAAGAPNPPFDPYRGLHELLTIYGDLFYGLRPANDIAIMMPYRQPLSPRGAWPAMQVFELYTTALFAHLPVSIVYREDIATLRDPATATIRPRAVLLTGLAAELPVEVSEGLKAFRARGGVVFVDAAFNRSIEGARRLPMQFDELRSLLSRSPALHGSDSLRVHIARICEKKAPALRRAVAAAVPLEVDVDNPRCVIGLQKYGTARYLVVANAETVPLKPEALWRQAAFEPTAFPARTTITLSGALAGCVVYDLFSGRKVETIAGGLTASFVADLTIAPGRVFVLLPAEVASVGLSVPRRVTLGAAVPVHVNVQTDDGRPLSGLVPVEITMIGPDKSVQVFHRAVPPEGLRVLLPTSANSKAGRIRVLVRELLGGHAAEAGAVAVSASFSEAVRSRPPIEVFDSAAIRRLIRGGKRCAILHEDSQTELAPAVDELLALFDGKQAAVVNANALQGAEASFDCIILPWMPGCSSVLLGQIEKLNSLPRRVSVAWPGRGRGALQVAFAPRRFGEDVIVVAGGDAVGVERAAAKLVEMAGGDVDNQPAEAQQPPVEFAFGTPLPAVPLPDRIRELFGPLCLEAAASRKGDFLAIGTQAWGNNLFLLNGRGDLVFGARAGKSYPAAPRQHVRHLAVLDNGDVYAQIADIEPPHVFLGRYRNGRLVERFAMMGRRAGGPGDGTQAPDRDDCTFAVSRDGTVAAAGNYGVAVFSNDGSELWRDDAWKSYDTLEALAAKVKWDAAISADGKWLAAANEKTGVSLRDLATGAAVWSAPWPDGIGFGRLLAVDAGRVVMHSGEALVCFSDGRLAWRYEPPLEERASYYGSYGRLAARACSDARHAIVCVSDGSVILLKDGRPLWSCKHDEAVFDAAFAPDASRVAVSTLDGLLACYDVSGKRLWSVQLASHAALAFVGGRLAAADARGVLRFYSAKGKLVQAVDLWAHAVRPELAKEFAAPEQGPVHRAGLPPWRNPPLPAGKPNVALGSQAEVQGLSGAVENDPKVLTNGVADDVDRPWMPMHEACMAASFGHQPRVSITFAGPRTVQAVLVKEHSRRPEAVPCEVAIEALQADGTWQTVRTDINVTGVTHIHTFQPVTTTAIRYTVVADLLNNLWTTEIEIY